MKLRSINEVKNLRDKRVLIRVDYNVDIKNGQVREIERLVRSLATINFVLKNGGKVILMSHLGRPDGKFDSRFSLKPLVKYLVKLTKKKVYFAPDCIGPKVLKSGEILLLENLRFYKEEESNDLNFAKKLAAGADLYVNEAFSNSHRAHASMLAITKFLPAYAGLNLADEVANLSRVVESIKKPSLAIIGGVKISTKIKVIDNLIKKYDKVIIGGALANNFFAAEKLNIGQSVIEKDYISVAARLLKKYKRKLVLPLDVVLTNDLKKNNKVWIVKIHDLNRFNAAKFNIVDIGLLTQKLYADIIRPCKTIVWNGPLGLFENKKFATGTNRIARAISQSRAFKVAGGGETIAAINSQKLFKKFNFISTAGGAMLEFLEGKGLVALKPLIKK